ncbi:MAG: hypothetical protein K9M98_10055, partial [Cephaloticoccus sp.]|nr:hypothetical protein [Cephaloticoccus sp.]
HDFSAQFIFQVVGSASRSAALSLNMLVFLAWQATLLVFIPKLTGSRTLGWMGFGLLLCLAWPWSNEAGSAVDFRLDHAAMCLLGITSVVALMTQGLRHTGWSLALGLAIGITILERFLTGAYFAVIFTACSAWVMFGPDRGLRLRNLLLAGLVCTLLTAPVFWANREGIYTYYWVGHVSGSESAARLRGFDLWTSVRFLLENLGVMHLGSWFGGVVVGITAGLLALTRLAPRTNKPVPDLNWLFIGLIFFLAPVAVLTVHPQKSEYVLGVLVPGIVLLVLWLWQFLWTHIDFSIGPRWRRWMPTTLALVTLGAGGGNFVTRQCAQPHDDEFLRSARSVNELADRIYAAAQKLHLPNPTIGVDQIVDFVDAQILGVICYERQHVWYSFVTQMPDSILAEPDDVIRYKLNLCDFILLTDQMPGDGYWPYDKAMRRLYPELKTWCETHRNLSKTFSIQGREMSLYQRSEFP